jgi:hypothetical protein
LTDGEKGCIDPIVARRRKTGVRVMRGNSQVREQAKAKDVTANIESSKKELSLICPSIK